MSIYEAPEYASWLDVRGENLYQRQNFRVWLEDVGAWRPGRAARMARRIAKICLCVEVGSGESCAMTHETRLPVAWMKCTLVQ